MASGSFKRGAAILSLVGALAASPVVERTAVRMNAPAIRKQVDVTLKRSGERAGVRSFQKRASEMTQYVKRSNQAHRQGNAGQAAQFRNLAEKRAVELYADSGFILRKNPRLRDRIMADPEGFPSSTSSTKRSEPKSKPYDPFWMFGGGVIGFLVFYFFFIDGDNGYSSTRELREETEELKEREKTSSSEPPQPDPFEEVVKETKSELEQVEKALGEHYVSASGLERSELKALSEKKERLEARLQSLRDAQKVVQQGGNLKQLITALAEKGARKMKHEAREAPGAPKRQPRRRPGR